MNLYVEKQLDDSYEVYRRHSMKGGRAYMSKEDFRKMFEEMMDVLYN